MQCLSPRKDRTKKRKRERKAIGKKQLTNLPWFAEATSAFSTRSPKCQGPLSAKKTRTGGWPGAEGTTLWTPGAEEGHSRVMVMSDLSGNECPLTLSLFQEPGAESWVWNRGKLQPI